MSEDLFDDREFGSASTSDLPWEVTGETSSILVGSQNIPSPHDDAFNVINCEQHSSATEEQRVSNSGSLSLPAADHMATGLLPSSALRQWEMRHEEQLEQKRKAEEEFKDSRKKVTEQQLDEWYKERETRLQKIRQRHRVQEGQQEKLRQQPAASQLATNSAASWGRVCELVEDQSHGSSLVATTTKLALQGESRAQTSGGKSKGVQDASTPGTSLPKDFTQDTKDTTRMRQLFVQLKTASTIPISNGLPG